jgi:hypothetical protein
MTSAKSVKSVKRFSLKNYHSKMNSEYQDSAKSCSLCELILLAVLQVREDVDNEYKGSKTSSVVDLDPHVVLPSGKKAVGAS